MCPFELINKPVPDFSGTAIQNGETKVIDPSSYLGQYLIIYFYPHDYPFVSPSELIDFSNHTRELSSQECNVIAVSCDSLIVHLNWLKCPREAEGPGKLDIPLLSDPNGHIAKAFGVYIEKKGIPFRSVFIIDKQGIVRYITVNDLPIVNICVSEIIKRLKFIKDNDESKSEWEISPDLSILRASPPSPTSQPIELVLEETKKQKTLDFSHAYDD